MGKKETIERIDKDGVQAAIHAQREAEKARSEEYEGAPDEYVVAGQGAFRGHEPGSTFKATFDPVEEARFLASGTLVKTAALADFASDAAEAKAKELDVDLTEVKPTGKGGRVTVADVEAAAKAQD